MDAFFSGTATTRAECDLLAESLCGGAVAPVPVQGAYSYTLVAAAGDEVIQFRPGDSKLPDAGAQLFRVFADAHPGLVAVHQHCGTLGTLEIYRMARLSGVSYPKALACYAARPKRRLELVDDLAQFFARSLQQARRSLSIDADERGQRKEACLRRLGDLYDTLPERFRPAIELLRGEMDELFDRDSGYPWLPVHGDLSWMNILVHETTGRLTGVIDLAELCLLPLGFDFYVVDEIVGIWFEGQGWVEDRGAAAVRAHFWGRLLALTGMPNTAMPRIKAAWLAGILFRYGTPSGTGTGLSGVLGTRNDQVAGYDILDGLASMFA